MANMQAMKTNEPSQVESDRKALESQTQETSHQYSQSESQPTDRPSSRLRVEGEGCVLQMHDVRIDNVPVLVDPPSV